MKFEVKEVECECGHRFESENWRSWCTKCGKPVYYDPKDQKRHKLNSVYMFLVFISVVFFLIYIYTELIARPFF